MKLLKWYFVWLLIPLYIVGHGLSIDTIVHLTNGNATIEQVAHLAKAEPLVVVSYDVRERVKSFNTIVTTGIVNTNRYVSFWCDGMDESTLCTLYQEWYRIDDDRWVPAVALQIGDRLKTLDGLVIITHTEQICSASMRRFVTLQISDTHAFFVGQKKLLTHNTVFYEASQGVVATASLFGGITVPGYCSLRLS